MVDVASEMLREALKAVKRRDAQLARGLCRARRRTDSSCLADAVEKSSSRECGEGAPDERSSPISDSEKAFWRAVWDFRLGRVNSAFTSESKIRSPFGPRSALFAESEGKVRSALYEDESCGLARVTSDDRILSGPRCAGGPPPDTMAVLSFSKSRRHRPPALFYQDNLA
jgi:hypothetical protein